MPQMVEPSPLRIHKIDHIEFAVSDLEQASELFLRLGFERISHRESRERQLRSYLFNQEEIYFLLSSSSLRTDPVAQFTASHGDGIFNIAFLCDDVVSNIELAEKRGAQIADRPRAYKKDFGQVQHASILAFGDVRHSFISRQGTLFLEGFETPLRPVTEGVGLSRIDHFVAVVSDADRSGWLRFYETVLGCKRSSGEHPYFAEVLSFAEQSLLFPLLTAGKLNPGRDFLDVNHGSGIQSVGLLCGRLSVTLEKLVSRGIPFLPVPNDYYDELQKGSGLNASQCEQLNRDQILCDRETNGFLLHAVTQPLIGPFRLQFLERQNASGVGENSFARLCRSVDKLRAYQVQQPEPQV